MRLYDFECLHCGHTFEDFVRSPDEAAELVCPSCGETGARKLLSGFAVQGGGRGGGSFSASSGCGSSGFS